MIDRGRQDLVTAKKLRWTMEFEKVSYDNAMAAKNQAAPSHMAVVRAAKAAAAASVSQTAAAAIAGSECDAAEPSMTARHEDVEMTVN